MNHTLVDLIDISKGFGDQIVLEDVYKRQIPMPVFRLQTPLSHGS